MALDNRILVVEDEATLRMVVSQVLTAEGFEITTAPNGEEALALFREDPYPVIFTDIIMDQMSGLDLLKEARGLSPDAVFVVMTSHASVETAIAALRAGAYDFLIKPFEDIEMISIVAKRAMERRKLMYENRVLIEQLKVNTHELEDLNRRLREVAITDGLTGLYNHRHFRDSLELELSRCHRHSHESSVIFVDIDNFKKFNDSNGHLAGDEALRVVAGLLSRTRKTDFAARYGGEEFVLIAPETGKLGAIHLAELLRKSVEATAFEIRPNQPTKKLTVSLGVATYPEDGEDSEEIIRQADKALYRAKEAGRNQVCAAGPGQTRAAS